MNFREVLAIIADFYNVLIWSAVFIIAGIKAIIARDMFEEETEQEEKEDNKTE